MSTLKPLITRLTDDLELESPLKMDADGSCTVPFDEGLKIQISETPQGLMLKCLIAPYPKVKEEVFSTQVMLGNLFGQGTHGAVLGLTLDGETLTLTQAVDYKLEYKEFRDILEDFINTIDLWREEVANHK